MTASGSTTTGQPCWAPSCRTRACTWAIDGERPGSGFTIHKTDVRPRNAELSAPATPAIATALDPHPEPAIRREGHTATAYWDLGTPAANGWQPRARLHIAYQDEIGFVATLCSVEELHHHGEHRERHRPLDPVVVHHHPTRRRSHHAVRECLRDAIDIVIAVAGQREPAVGVHFVPIVAAETER